MGTTEDKNFINQNSHKPFIRTMEDDLKKIKSGVSKKDGGVSGLSGSSLAIKTMPAPAVKKPVPVSPVKKPIAPETVSAPAKPFIPPPFAATKPEIVQKPISAKPIDQVAISQEPKAAVSTAEAASSNKATSFVSSIPKNLPIDTQESVRKDKFNENETSARESIIKEADGKVVEQKVQKNAGFSRENSSESIKTPSAGSAPISPDLSSSPVFPIKSKTQVLSQPGSEPKNISSERPIESAISRPVLKPTPKPAVPSVPVYSPKVQSARRVINEDENLSPEARLARQSSFGMDGYEMQNNPLKAAYPMNNADRTAARIDETKKMDVPNFQDALSFKDRSKTIEEIIKEDSSPKPFLKKFAKTLFVFLIMIGIGVGAYYLFSYYKIKSIQQPPASVLTRSYIKDATEITIDSDANVDLRDSIRAYFASPSSSRLYRVVFKDKAGNSLSLTDFDKRLGIILPPDIANSLDKDYNLIVFNRPEKNYLRLGLILRPQKKSDFLASVRKWELNMYKDVEPMFLGDSGVYDPERQFGTNSRSNFIIKYLPLGSESIGLNYAIDNNDNFLLIATSKEDIFTLIDNIKKENN